MRVYLLKGGLQIEVPVKFMVYYKFPNLIKMTHIFPLKKGRDSFEKSHNITAPGFGGVHIALYCIHVHVVF